MRNWSQEEIKRYLGPSLACYLSHSRDASVRAGAASGGTTSQLAINMLENGFVDGVLVWRMVFGEAAPRTEAAIATNRAEVLAARTSKYCSVRWPRDAMPLVEAFPGRLAVTTLPCDASYLRRKLRADPALSGKIRCVLTLFCGHNSEPELTELLVRRFGVGWREVESFSYRTGPWRGRLHFRTRDGREFDAPTSMFTHYQNLHLFSERKCLACVDHFGYDGDLCLGDVWSQAERGRDVKPTVVVVKTERGREVLEHFGSDLALTPIEPAAVLAGNSRGMTFHYNITARARVGRAFGVRIPDRLRLPTTLLDRLVAFFAVGNFWLSHHPRLKRLVHGSPRWLVRGYVFLFKGLQHANLFFYRPFPPVPKFSIIGATLVGNRGAEAMLTTTVARLRAAFPEARFVLHSYLPAADRRGCRDLDVEIVDARPAALVLGHLPFALLDRLLRYLGMGWPRRWMPRAVRELAQSRVLIDVFGISYSDGREKFLPFNVLSNWPGMLLGIPVVKLSQGMGPFRNPWNRRLASWMLRRCERVYARGDGTLAHCAGLGLDDRLDRAADVAFLFRADYALTAENTAFEREVCARLAALRAAGRTVLVLSLSSVVLGKCRARGIDYVARMEAVAREYSKRGFAVVLFPNASREGSRSLRNNDLPVVTELMRSLADLEQEGLVVVDRALNAGSLGRVLALGDLLVASRFHAMVAGLSLAIPTLVLGWGHKYREVLAQFGCEEWALDFLESEPELLIARIDALIEQAGSIRTRIRSHRDEVLRSAQSQFDWLTTFLRPEANLCTEDD